MTAARKLSIAMLARDMDQAPGCAVGTPGIAVRADTGNGSGTSAGGFLARTGSKRTPGPGGGLRGGPIRAGWNRTAAAIVQTSANAMSLPMLDIAGLPD